MDTKAYQEFILRAVKSDGISYKELSENLKATTGTVFPNGNFRDISGLYWKRFPNGKWWPVIPKP